MDRVRVEIGINKIEGDELDLANMCKDKLLEVLEENEIPPLMGINVMYNIIARHFLFVEKFSYEEFREAIMGIVEQSEDIWREHEEGQDQG